MAEAVYGRCGFGSGDPLADIAENPKLTPFLLLVEKFEDTFGREAMVVIMKAVMGGYFIGVEQGRIEALMDPAKVMAEEFTKRVNFERTGSVCGGS